MTIIQVRQSKFAAGFTMAEVMIVVLIMGIVTLAGLPLLTTSMDHYRLKGATEEVVNAFQYARSSALSSGRQTKVIIGDSSNQIFVRQYTISANLTSGGNQLVANDVESGSYELMEYPLKKGTNYSISFNNEDRFRGVVISASDFNPEDEVYFDSMGHPSHGGTVTLTLKGQQMVVTLDALTGKASTSD